MTLSLTGQLGEVEAEIAMREKVYPRLVAQGKMRQGEADYKIAAMKDVLGTLHWLMRNEAAIKAKGATNA